MPLRTVYCATVGFFVADDRATPIFTHDRLIGPIWSDCASVLDEQIIYGIVNCFALPTGVFHRCMVGFVIGCMVGVVGGRLCAVYTGGICIRDDVGVRCCVCATRIAFVRHGSRCSWFLAMWLLLGLQSVPMTVRSVVMDIPP